MSSSFFALFLLQACLAGSLFAACACCTIANLVKAAIVHILHYLCVMPLTTILHALTQVGNVIVAHVTATIEFNMFTGGALLPLLIYLYMVRLVYTVKLYKVHINIFGTSLTFRLPLPRLRIHHRKRRGSGGSCASSSGVLRHRTALRHRSRSDPKVLGQSPSHSPATVLSLCVARDLSAFLVFYFALFV